MLSLRKLIRYIKDEVHIIYRPLKQYNEKGSRINTNFIGISYGCHETIDQANLYIISNSYNLIEYCISDGHTTNIMLKYQHEYIIIIEKQSNWISVFVNKKYKDLSGWSSNYFEIRSKYYKFKYHETPKITVLDPVRYTDYFDNKYPNANRIEI
jgi:hypothetical protein